ncbi:hypothetical protein DACRYDRAFT_113162 [Dacryopinax primogenitus]|uniref:Nuclear pore complex protein Nup160 n=1 Tax=Dacryopinax primogenitus (strain DJM 731) TaxID=1858805 RepID=M5GCW1_DACPD|nr:uncharacterized protein DACRYDRAFT_113162 [Dacryopinax primogenitus]EJU06460.1 hypothetical protein DACRYDRAFT_113162 [Dacryopinax primogenitus]
MASLLLSTAHLSNIYPISQPITVPTTQSGLALLPDPATHRTEADLASSASSHLWPEIGRVLARVVNDRRTLELTHLSSDCPPIRFLLPSRALGNPGVAFEQQTSSLHVLILTEANSLYRLNFPAPALFNTAPLPRNWCKEYVVKSVLEGDGPVSLMDMSTVLIGLRDGGVLKLDQTRMSRPEVVDGLTSFYDTTWKETPIRPSSLYNALTSFIPFTSGSAYENPAHIVSLDCASSSALTGFAFTVSRDRRLRVWHLPSSTCVRTEELPSSPTAVALEASPQKRRPLPLLPAESRRLVRFLPPLPNAPAHARTSRVLVFLPTPSDPTSAGYFTLFELHLSHGHVHSVPILGQKPASEQSAGADIRDFCVEKGRLYVLWDQGGRTLLESTPLEFGELAQSRSTAKWTSAIMPEEPDMHSGHSLYRPSSSSTSEEDDQMLPSLIHMYSSPLTTPGLFSPLALRAALREYTSQLLSDLPQDEVLPPTLSEKYESSLQGIIAGVGCAVPLERDGETGLWKWDAQREGVRREWERFGAIAVELERAGRVPLSLGTGREGEVLVLERERVGVLAEFEPPGTGSKAERGLLEFARALVRATGSQGYAEYVQEVLATVRAPIEQSTEDLSMGLYERTIRPLLGNVPELLSGLQGLSDIGSTVQGLVKSLLNLNTFTDTLPVGEGELWNGWVTSYICSFAKSRADAVLSLFALLIFALVEAPGSLQDSTALLGSALVALHSISTLTYLCQQPGGNPLRKTGPGGAEEDFAVRFGRLAVGTEKQGGGLRRGINYCLIHSLLPESSQAVNVRESAFDFVRGSGVLEVRREIGVLSGDVKFFNELRMKGHLQVVVEVAGWYPRSPALSYVLGRTLLELKRGQEAAEVLEGVASVFDEHTAATLLDKQAVIAVLPIPEFQATRSFIYQQIASWFEQASSLSLAVLYWKLAIDTAASKSDLAHLWYKISAAQIELGLFEDAYGTLMATPHRDQQDNTLRKLIDVMCSSGEADRLVRMSFAGLQSTVEDILDFKARNHDPLQPPDYSLILYSWHVLRGNYRAAGAAMYHHGRRLGALTNPKLDHHGVTLNQAHAFLAAINSLSLVEPRNAWVVSTRADRDPGEHIPVIHHIPTELFASGMQERELTSIEDIRREYVLALARLELLPHLQDLGTTGIQLSPEDAVAAFAQYGMYDSAFNTASSLGVDMSGLFKDLARKCTSIRSDTGIDTMNVAPWLELASERIGSWDGSIGEKAWRYLRECLERYDLPGTGYRYYKDVLEAMLAYNRHNRVPNWLSKFFEDHQPEHLIRTFLRYGLVQDAVAYTITLIQKARNAGDLSHRVSLTYELVKRQAHPDTRCY